MLPYLLLLSFVMFWIYLEKKSLNRNAFWVPFFALVLFASIRSYLVGTDTGAYTSDFRNQVNPENFIFRENVEIGYQLLSYLVLNLTYNYFWLFFITSTIVVGSYLVFFKKYSQEYFLSVLIFLSFGLYTFYFNGLRQGLAMAVVVWSTPYLMNKKLLNFSLIVLLGSLFHKSALIMFIFYFLINFRVKMEYKILSVFLGSLLLSGLGIEYLASVNDKYSAYSEVSENSGGYLTLSLYFIIGVFFYIFYKFYKIKDKNFNVFLQLYILGIVFLIPVAMLGANPSGPQRLVFYFTWTIAIIIPTIFNKINNNKIYYIFIVLCMLYFYLRISSFSNLTPYQLNEIFRIF